MLYLIGLGLNPKELTLEALEALKGCKSVYLEDYTSKYSEGSQKSLEKIIGKKVIPLSREEVEEIKPFLTHAKTKDTALCIYGNITSATTHSEIIQTAKDRKIKVKVIPGISIFSVIPMLTGLQEYKFGRTISIVRPEKNYFPKSFFDYFLKNQELGLHTILLLDIKKEQNYFMSPSEATKILLDIAKEREIKLGKAIVICNAMGKSQIVEYKELEKIAKAKYPKDSICCLVIPGKLHESEKEALEEL
ncbi:MAG: diphthine synthase [Candidatus ainarchaeum sp.]|nr:diphthine synthase [Candidatus ainarchaeum sp.]